MGGHEITFRLICAAVVLGSLWGCGAVKVRTEAPVSVTAGVALSAEAQQLVAERP
jgi:hypothetical protein